MQDIINYNIYENTAINYFMRPILIYLNILLVFNFLIKNAMYTVLLIVVYKLSIGNTDIRKEDKIITTLLKPTIIIIIK